MLEKDPGEFSNFCKHQNISIDDWIEGGPSVDQRSTYTKHQLDSLLKR